MTIQEQLKQKADYIIEQYRGGRGTRSLGEEFGCNSGNIWFFLKAHGVDIKRRSRMYGRAEEFFSQVKQLFDKGVSAYAIAKRLELNKHLVLRLLKKHGLSTSEKSTARTEPLINHRDQIISRYLDGDSTIEIAKDFNSGSSSIWSLLKKSDVQLRDVRKYSCNETFFDVIDSELKSYLLGWFYSDGNNMGGKSGIRMQITDRDMLYKMKEAMSSTGPIYIRPPRKVNHKTQYAMYLRSEHLSNALTQKGCPPRKSLILKFPGPEIVSTHLIRHFVRGYFDGDGSFGCHGRAKRWRIQVVGTKHITEGINSSARTNGIFVQRHPERQKDNWTLMIHRKEEVRVWLGWIYQDASIFLRRKFDKYLAFCKQYGLTPVTTAGRGV